MSRVLTAGIHELLSGPARPRSSVVLTLLVLAVLPGQIAAQVLVVTPSCGVAGSDVLITGSGWAEPAPVCEYLFIFDGTEFAPRQPDGLFGPPNRMATIPAGSKPGEHTVKVELRLNSDGSLLQCRQTPFKVVEMLEDPWDNGITTPGGDSVRVEFDPADVCDVTPCDKIVLIQVKRPLGEKADGTMRPLSHTEQGFPNAAKLDADLTSAGYSIDYIVGEADPYYNGDDSADGIQQGVQNGTPKESIIVDRPSRTDASYPADIVKIILEFEVAAFCAQGHDRGQFLGKMEWKWERPKMGSATATFLSASRNQPSANFNAALSFWNANHNFSFPTTGSPTTGGMPCN